MKVKVCGITNEEDAHAAVDAGADALGFIFVSSSPRYIPPATARRIIRKLPPFVTPVGVFVNASRQDIGAAIEETGILCLQLHGDGTPDEMTGYPITAYKAFRVHDEFRVETLSHYPTGVHLLDTYIDGQHGGTGRAFNWQIAIEAKRYGRIILSGGITPENVGEAVRRVRPYAIDVNSGVESSPGKKDGSKMRELFEALSTI